MNKENGTTEMIKVKRGYTLKISGEPDKKVIEAERPDHVAVKPIDFPLMKPVLAVKEGDTVQAGSILFYPKHNHSIKFAAPLSGVVIEIKRGFRRILSEIIIKTDPVDTYNEFEKIDSTREGDLSPDKLKEQLLASGMWPVIREFPLSIIADPDSQPRDVYVSFFCKEPFSPDLLPFVADAEEEYALGFKALKVLSGSRINVCVPCSILNETLEVIQRFPDINVIKVSGKYPAGHPAVQCYHHKPLKSGEKIWYMNGWDVQRIGEFLKTGHYPSKRVIALGGSIEKNSYIQTVMGASIDSLVGELSTEDECRYISGGVFTGKHNTLEPDQKGFLGFYDYAVHIIKEGRKRNLLSFMMPGWGRQSITKLFPSSFLPQSVKELNTNIQGESRECVQCNLCDTVCPVDILPGLLYRSIVSDDIDETMQLGIHDCADCGLCAYVCPSKIELGSIIRDYKEYIVKEESK